MAEPQLETAIHPMGAIQDASRVEYEVLRETQQTRALHGGALKQWEQYLRYLSRKIHKLRRRIPTAVVEKAPPKKRSQASRRRWRKARLKVVTVNLMKPDRRVVEYCVMMCERSLARSFLMERRFTEDVRSNVRRRQYKRGKLEMAVKNLDVLRSGTAEKPEIYFEPKTAVQLRIYYLEIQARVLGLRGKRASALELLDEAIFLSRRLSAIDKEMTPLLARMISNLMRLKTLCGPSTTSSGEGVCNATRLLETLGINSSTGTVTSCGATAGGRPVEDREQIPLRCHLMTEQRVIEIDKPAVVFDTQPGLRALHSQALLEWLQGCAGKTEKSFSRELVGISVATKRTSPSPPLPGSVLEAIDESLEILDDSISSLAGGDLAGEFSLARSWLQCWRNFLKIIEICRTLRFRLHKSRAIQYLLAHIHSNDETSGKTDLLDTQAYLDTTLSQALHPEKELQMCQIAIELLNDCLQRFSSHSQLSCLQSLAHNLLVLFKNFKASQLALLFVTENHWQQTFALSRLVAQREVELLGDFAGTTENDPAASPEIVLSFLGQEAAALNAELLVAGRQLQAIATVICLKRTAASASSRAAEGLISASASGINVAKETDTQTPFTSPSPALTPIPTGLPMHRRIVPRPRPIYPKPIMMDMIHPLLEPANLEFFTELCRPTGTAPASPADLGMPVSKDRAPAVGGLSKILTGWWR